MATSRGIYAELGLGTTYAQGNSGTTQTIPDVSVSDALFSYTLTGNCTFTLPTPVAGAVFQVLLTQDGTGSRTATFTPTPKFPAGTAPTLSTGANKVDLLTFRSWNGTNWANTSAILDIR